MINVRQLLRDTPASRGTGSDELANMLDSLRMHWDRIRGLLKHNRSIKRVETRQGVSFGSPSTHPLLPPHPPGKRGTG